MNNVFVYLEIEGTTVADVSLELLTKGRKLANQLGCQLEAVAAGNNLVGIEKQVLPFGVPFCIMNLRVTFSGKVKDLEICSRSESES